MQYRNDDNFFYPVISKANTVYTPLSFNNEKLIAPYEADITRYNSDRDNLQINKFAGVYGDSNWPSYLENNANGLRLDNYKVLTGTPTAFKFHKTSLNTSVTQMAVEHFASGISAKNTSIHWITPTTTAIQTEDADLFWNINELPATMQNANNLKLNIGFLFELNKNLFEPVAMTGDISNPGPIGITGSIRNVFNSAGLQSSDVINYVTVNGIYQPSIYNFYVAIKGCNSIGATAQGDTDNYALIGGTNSADTQNYYVKAGNIKNDKRIDGTAFRDDINQEWLYNYKVKNFDKSNDANNTYFVGSVSLDLIKASPNGTTLSAFSSPVLGINVNDTKKWTNATAIANCTNGNTYTAYGDFNDFIQVYPSYWSNGNFNVFDYNFGVSANL